MTIYLFFLPKRGTWLQMKEVNNTNHAMEQAQRHLLEVDIISPATRKFFCQVFVFLARMSRLLASKNLKMIKSVKICFSTFPNAHPCLLKPLL